MKYLFLIVCVACAVALSMLSAVYKAGNLSFVPRVEKSDAKDKPVEGEKLAGLVGQKETVDDLVLALKREKQAYEKKSGELLAKEQTLSNEIEVVSMLKTELEKSRSSLDAKIVETDAAEQVNLKRLSVIYSKMEAEGASTLLREMSSDRAAKILNLIPERQAAAILGAAVGGGEPGTKKAADWSDVIRRMKQEKIKKGP